MGLRRIYIIHTAMTVVSESSYKIEIDVVTDGQASKELLVAQRVGDCTK